MKFCKNCSASLEDNAVFCTECGASLADDSFQSGGQSSSEGFQGTIPGSSSSSNLGDSQYSSTDSYSSGSDYSSDTNYSQPQQHYSAPQGKSPATPWLIVSIVSLFCCGGLLAIPGLILSIMSSSSFNAGDIAEAEQKANTAKWLSIGAIILAVIAIILFFALGMFAAFQDGYVSQYR